MKTMSLLLSATSALLATAMPASAATLLYSFTPTTGNQTFSFNVDSNPTPVSSLAGQFSVNVTNFVRRGVVQTDPQSLIFTFYAASGSTGGFGNILIGDFGGPQLYAGLVSAPTLQAGNFALTGGPNNRGGRLTVSTVAAIPEPATWAMMAVGFGLAASAMRRRKVTTRVSYAPSYR